MLAPRRRLVQRHQPGSLLLALLLVATAGCRKAPSAGQAATLPVAHNSASELPEAGLYGTTLTLIRQPGGGLIGSFDESSGEQPSFSCAFLIASAGPLSPEKRMPITTWWPDRELNGGTDDQVTTGTLFFQGGVVSLQLPEQAHGGCWNVEPELDHGEITEIGSGVPHPEWKAIRVVSAHKLPFHHSPDAKDASKAYLVHGDTIAVLNEAPTQGDFQHVQLLGPEGAKGSGWILNSGLLPWSIPAH